MTRTGVFLRDLIEDLRFEDLPANWNSFDLESFSKSKKLWDYQQKAVENAIKVLWEYLQFRTDDVSKVPDEYKRYWFDDIGKMLGVIK